MHRFGGLSRGGRLLIALAVGGAIFGIASAVQADIPDSGVIHGCYGKPGTTHKGELRVRDASQGEQCRYYENQLDWNQTGPTGATGATAPTGPTGPSGSSFLVGSSGNSTIGVGVSTSVGVGANFIAGGNPFSLMPVAGTLSHLHVDVTVGTTGSSTFTVWKNSVPTSLTCTISQANDCSDATDTVSFNEGDDVLLWVVNNFTVPFAVSWSARTG